MNILINYLFYDILLIIVACLAGYFISPWCFLLIFFIDDGIDRKAQEK